MEILYLARYKNCKQVFGILRRTAYPELGFIGGAAGYFTGRTVSETVYDRITQKGISLGHR